MNTVTALESFALKTLVKGRISFGDVQRLQRDFLADGIASREEATLLIGLDGGVAKADPAWTRFLVAALVDLVVWGERPTGIVEEETAAWLAATLAAEGSARTGRLVAREIASEAHAFENDALQALARMSRPAGRRPRAAHAVAEEAPLAA